MYKCDGCISVCDVEKIIHTLIDQETNGYRITAFDLILDGLLVAANDILDLSYEELLQHFKDEYEYVTKYRK